MKKLARIKITALLFLSLFLSLNSTAQPLTFANAETVLNSFTSTYQDNRTPWFDQCDVLRGYGFALLSFYTEGYENSAYKDFTHTFIFQNVVNKNDKVNLASHKNFAKQTNSLISQFVSVYMETQDLATYYSWINQINTGGYILKSQGNPFELTYSKTVPSGIPYLYYWISCKQNNKTNGRSQESTSPQTYSIELVKSYKAVKY